MVDMKDMLTHFFLMHYLSLKVKKRLCGCEAPIIVGVGILQGSCVHFQSLVTAAALFFILSGSENNLQGKEAI